MSRNETDPGAEPQARPAAGGVVSPRVAAHDAPASTAADRTIEELADRLAFAERRLEALENARRPIVHPVLPDRDNERLGRLLAVIQESVRDLAEQVRDVQEQVTALAASSFEAGDGMSAARAATALASPHLDVLTRRLLVLEGRVRTLSRFSPLTLRRLAGWLLHLPGRVVRRAGRDTVRAARAAGRLAGRGSAAPELFPTSPAGTIRHVMARRTPPARPLLSVVLPVHGGDGEAELRSALARQSMANREVAVWDVETGRYRIEDAAGSARTQGVAASAQELRVELAGEYVVAWRHGAEALPADWLEVGAFAAAAEGLAFVRLACERSDGRPCHHPSAVVSPEPGPSRDSVIVRRDLWTLDPFADAAAWRAEARVEGLVIGKVLYRRGAPLAVRESAAATAIVPAGLTARWVGPYLVTGSSDGGEVVHAVFDVADALAPADGTGRRAALAVLVAAAQPAADPVVLAALEALATEGGAPAIVMLADTSGLPATVRERWDRIGGGALELSAQLPRELHGSFLLAVAASRGCDRVLVVGPAALDPAALAPLRARAPRLRVVGWLTADDAAAPELAGAEDWLDGIVVSGAAAMEAAVPRWPKLAARCWQVPSAREAGAAGAAQPRDAAAAAKQVAAALG
jgi:hypothetical protein